MNNSSFLKALIIGVIAMFVFFSYKMRTSNDAPVVTNTNIPKLDFAEFGVKTKLQRNDLLKDIPNNITPFRPLFFETMALKGIMKDNFNRWNAIFAGSTVEGSSQLIKLAKGDTHDGITLKEIDSNGCLVLYGSIERRFELR